MAATPMAVVVVVDATAAAVTVQSVPSAMPKVANALSVPHAVNAPNGVSATKATVAKAAAHALKQAAGLLQ